MHRVFELPQIFAGIDAVITIATTTTVVVVYTIGDRWGGQGR